MNEASSPGADEPAEAPAQGPAAAHAPPRPPTAARRCHLTLAPSLRSCLLRAWCLVGT